MGGSGRIGTLTGRFVHTFRRDAELLLPPLPQIPSARSKFWRRFDAAVLSVAADPDTAVRDRLRKLVKTDAEVKKLEDLHRERSGEHEDG